MALAGFSRHVPERRAAGSFPCSPPPSLGQGSALFDGPLRRYPRQLPVWILCRELGAMVSAVVSHGIRRVFAQQDPHPHDCRRGVPPKLERSRFSPWRRAVQEPVGERFDRGGQLSCRLSRVGALVFLVYPRQAVCQAEVDARLCPDENLAAKNKETVTRTRYTRLQARCFYVRKNATKVACTLSLPGFGRKTLPSLPVETAESSIAQAHGIQQIGIGRVNQSARSGVSEKALIPRQGGQILGPGRSFDNGASLIPGIGRA